MRISLRILFKVPLIDAFVIVLVTVVTVYEDLAVAVVVGVIVSALAYAWNNARRIHAKSYVTPEGAKVYQIQGPLFFGSSEGFAELFDVVYSWRNTMVAMSPQPQSQMPNTRLQTKE